MHKGGDRISPWLIFFFILMIAFGILAAMYGADRDSRDPGLVTTVQAQGCPQEPTG